MFGFGLGEIQDIAVGQIKGYIQPTAIERAAAFELFVELSSRTATVTLADEHRLIRDVLDNLALMPDITRTVLRQHGAASAKQRTDGNLALAAVALRVVNEIILPRLNRWGPLLRHWEDLRPPEAAATEWEQDWDEFENCRADLESMRGEIRAYLDTLAKIAGAPALGDLVVPNPPGLPIPPITLAEPVGKPMGAKPRERMVGWVNVFEMASTALAHRRHHAHKPGGRRPATDAAPEAIDLTWLETDDENRFWFDYVADMGDAFDPTAAVAWQLTRSSVTLPIDRSGELPKPPPKLPRGRLLVMGGDQVYPHATEAAYSNQLILPYQLTADAQTETEQPSPDDNVVIAIPGNHDWIGGPQFFEDVFVHADEFASHWHTPQQQRWWAVRLPGQWWLWGIDTALDNRVSDTAQREYFAQMSGLLGDGDQVIVCTPVPLWQRRQKREEDYFELRKQLNTWINSRGARTPLFISGDTHMFAHYRRVDGAADEHHICAGGGGAFLQPTHNLPEQVPYERGASDFKLGQRWPRPVDSRSLGASVGALSQFQFQILFVVVGLIHAGFAGLIAGRFGQGDSEDPNSVKSAIGAVTSTWLAWPAMLLLLVAMIAMTVPNSRESSLSSGAKRYGAMHGAGQIAVFVGVAAAGRWAWPEWWWRFLIAPAIGGVLSVALFVWFVRWINRSIRANDTLAFSPAHVMRYKNFVRMSIDENDNLNVYVIGLDPVGKHWFTALTKPDGVIPPFDRDGVPRLHYVWGRTFTKGNEHQIMELERLLGTDHPDTIFHRSARARRLIDDRLLQDAIELLDLNIESCIATHGLRHPITETNMVLKAEARLESGEPDYAFEVLPLILGDDPDPGAPTWGTSSSQVSYLLSQAYDQVDDTENAMRWLQRALAPADLNDDWDVTATEWRLYLASCMETLGLDQEAIELSASIKSHADQARVAEPSMTGMFLLSQLALGRILLRTDIERGIEEIEAALGLCDELRPDLATHARDQLAGAYAQIGESDRAIELRREILDRSRSHSAEIRNTSSRFEALTDLAYEMEIIGEAYNAAAYWEQAVAEASRDHGDADPATLELRLRLADSILETGDAQRALTLLESVRSCLVDTAPRESAAINSVDLSIGRAYRSLGELDRALAVFEHLDDTMSGSDPNSAVFYGLWTNITTTLMELGQADRAIARMRATYTLLQETRSENRRDELSACRALADLLIAAGRPEEAIDVLRDGLDALPTDADVVERTEFEFGVRQRLINAHVANGDIHAASAIVDEWRKSPDGAQIASDHHALLIRTLLVAADDRLPYDVASTLVEEMLVIATDLFGADSVQARDVRRLRAGVELTNGSAELAIERWQDLLAEPGRHDHDDNEARDRLHLAKALWFAGHEDRALEAGEQALAAQLASAEPDETVLTDLRFRIGRASLGVGDFDRAVALLGIVHRALVDEPDDFNALWLAQVSALLANALDGVGRRAEAIDMAMRARATAAAHLPRSASERIEIETLIAPVLAGDDPADRVR